MDRRSYKALSAVAIAVLACAMPETAEAARPIVDVEARISAEPVLSVRMTRELQREWPNASLEAFLASTLRRALGRGFPLFDFESAAVNEPKLSFRLIRGSRDPWPDGDVKLHVDLVLPGHAPVDLGLEPIALERNPDRTRAYSSLYPAEWLEDVVTRELVKNKDFISLLGQVPIRAPGVVLSGGTVITSLDWREYGLDRQTKRAWFVVFDTSDGYERKLTFLGCKAHQTIAGPLVDANNSDCVVSRPQAGGGPWNEVFFAGFAPLR